jgi:RNA polymerase sigma factor (TIGR02999 family)
MGDVTCILAAIEKGDSSAQDQLLAILYDELRQLAAAKLAREKPGNTLQPTGLVHEAYLRLLGPNGARQTWGSRGHFFAAAAEAMRRILIDAARRKSSDKHGGGMRRVELDEERFPGTGQSDNLIALDEALNRLEQEDHEAARLVKLRYFAGLTIPQAAEILGVSPRKADFMWSYARAWLRRELAAD